MTIIDKVEEFGSLSALWSACRRKKRGAFAGDVWISVACPWKKFGYQQVKMSGIWQVMAKVEGYELMRREVEGDHHVWATKVISRPVEDWKSDHFALAVGEIIILPEINTTKRKKAS
jgi:hypothetical protein